MYYFDVSSYIAMIEGSDGHVLQSIQHLTALENFWLYRGWDGIGMARAEEASVSSIKISSKIGLSSGGASTGHLSATSRDF